jgi:hypothetical protein
VRYVEAGRFEARSLAAVAAELGAARAATVALVRSAVPGDFSFRLRVGSGSLTGAALAYLIAGHERHHQHRLRSLRLPRLPDHP